MNRLPQLDALRGLAVLGVILNHSIKWEFHFPLGPWSVRLFFVLSGYLITGILLRARDKSGDQARGYALGSFYARRFLRIFPIYYLSLVALFLLGQPEIRETIGWHLLYLSNVLSAQPSRDIPAIWGHLWSLSVEEQFYLLWPGLVLFMPRRWLPATFVGAVLFGVAFRWFAPVWFGLKAAMYLTPGCLDSLALGACLAWLATCPTRDVLRHRFSTLALVAGVALIAATMAATYLDVAWRLRVTLNNLAPALVSIWLVNGAADRFGGWSGRILEFRPLIYLGTISYGVYLLHNFVPWLCQSAALPLPSHGIARFILLTAITTLLAAVSWHFVEKPLNELKDRFPYVRSSPPVAHTEIENSSMSGLHLDGPSA